MIKGTLVRIAIVAIIFIVLEWFGFWVWIGAHPFWSTKVTTIGIISGAIVSLLALILSGRIGISTKTILATMIALTAIIAAITLLYGKAQFVASYAENGFAGRVWYIGFMALITGAFASLVELTRLKLRTLATNS